MASLLSHSFDIHDLYTISHNVEEKRKTFVTSISIAITLSGEITQTRYGLFEIVDNSLRKEGLLKGQVVNCCLDFGELDLINGIFVIFITPDNELILNRLDYRNNQIVNLCGCPLLLQPPEIAVLGILNR